MLCLILYYSCMANNGKLRGLRVIEGMQNTDINEKKCMCFLILEIIMIMVMIMIMMNWILDET